MISFVMVERISSTADDATASAISISEHHETESSTEDIHTSLAPQNTIIVYVCSEQTCF